jgi:multiple sugar transport system ATP-binding protein
VVLNAGNIEQIGAPLELYHRPRNLFVAGFIGSPKMNFLRGKLISSEGKVAEVVLAGGEKLRVAVDASNAAKDSDVTLGIRPEHMIQAPAAGTNDMGRLRGQVVLVENLGEGSLIYVKLPGVDGLAVCRAEGTSYAKVNDVIEIGVPVLATHLFDSTGRAFERPPEAITSPLPS